LFSGLDFPADIFFISDKTAFHKFSFEWKSRASPCSRQRTHWEDLKAGARDLRVPNL